MPDKDGPADKWSSDEKFAVVLETASMNKTELAKYCRGRGVFVEQVKQWKKACLSANESPSKAQKLDAQLGQEKIKRLEKELARKEKALAETAALLVLRKRRMRSGGRERTHDQHPRSCQSSRVNQ